MEVISEMLNPYRPPRRSVGCFVLKEYETGISQLVQLKNHTLNTYVANCNQMPLLSKSFVLNASSNV